MVNSKNIGRKIVTIRSSINMQQYLLAELSKVSRTYLGNIERGTVNVTVDILIKIIAPLNYTLSDFFKEIEYGNIKTKSSWDTLDDEGWPLL